MSFYVEYIVDDHVTVVKIFFVSQSAVCKCHTPQTTLSVRDQTFCYKTIYKSLTVTNKTNKVVNRLMGGV